MINFKTSRSNLLKRVRNIKFNTKEKAVLCGFLFAILFSAAGFGSKCDSISSKVFRLHILANSDSSEDQELKLKVRDKILEMHSPCFDGIYNLTYAKAITNENLDNIKKTAKIEVIKNGYDYDVDVEINNIYFNTRKYCEVTMPAGNYDALKITIGEGKGKNWWCVMFPPMCLPASQERQELESVLTLDELDVVENGFKYEFKFKAVEVFFETKRWLEKRFDFFFNLFV